MVKTPYKSMHLIASIFVMTKGQELRTEMQELREAASQDAL